MKTISVSEFNMLCRELHLKQYIYDTRNQDEDDTLDGTVFISARYTTVMTALCPSSICFKNDMSCLCFEKVKYVYANRKKHCPGLIFSIVCEDNACSSGVRTHIIIAD